MGRKLLLSYSILFVVFPFLLILLFGGTFISETEITTTNEDLLPLYISLTTINLFASMLIIVYIFLFCLKIDRTPDVKWIIISAFIGYNIYVIITLISIFQALDLKFHIISDPTSRVKLLNILTYLPLIMVPFTLVIPLFSFSKLYLTTSKGGRGTVII